LLEESAEATLLTLRNLSWHHERIDTVPDPDHRATETVQLTHAATQFQSTSLRLKSLEKRMDNIIALVRLIPFTDCESGQGQETLVDIISVKSFHLVTQDGNRIMQADINSMATIAFVALTFLPMSTVSASSISIVIREVHY
jgi:hypothetical protein